MRDTESELAAVAAFAAERSNWEVVLLRCASANPGGPIEEPAFAAIRDEIVAGLSARRWDAVYLSLHGAAITAERGAADLDLIRSVRKSIGDTPLAASFDLHANLNPEVVSLLDFASAYRTHPHTDMRATAERVLARLESIAAGQVRPFGVLQTTGLALPSFNMRTNCAPMAEIMSSARAAETGPVVDVSVFGGFPYADTPDSGASVMAWSESHPDSARAACEMIRSELVARRSAFRVSIPGPNQALSEALRAPAGLVAVTDPADNPLSGGAADTPGLFRALLDAHPAENAVFAFFADPEVAARCHAMGTGATVDVELGAKTSRDFGASVRVSAKVRRLTDGRFRNRGPMETGLTVDLGRTAVLDVAGIQVIVTSRCLSANDPAFFDLHGIDLAQTRLLCVKAKNHFRAAFEPLCARIIDCDTPGPASADLSHLPFRNLRLH